MIMIVRQAPGGNNAAQIEFLATSRDLPRNPAIPG
jgi:hypothetical protein